MWLLCQSKLCNLEVGKNNFKQKNLDLMFKQLDENFTLLYLWRRRVEWRLIISSQSVWKILECEDPDFIKLTTLTSSSRMICSSLGSCLDARICLWMQQWFRLYWALPSWQDREDHSKILAKTYLHQCKAHNNYTS